MIFIFVLYKCIWLTKVLKEKEKEETIYDRLKKKYIHLDN